MSKGSITISICEDISDWFRIIDRKINLDNYTHFALRAKNLAWYLYMYNSDQLIDSVQVETSPRILIEKLNITEIKANRYRTIKSILNP